MNNTIDEDENETRRREEICELRKVKKRYTAQNTVILAFWT
jgi:hypothetical protein